MESNEGISMCKENNVRNGEKITKRNSTIDFLKGISILFVIATHYQWTNEQRLLYGFPFWIDMAVPIFMILSGYTWTISFDKKRIQSIIDCYNLRLIFNKWLRYTIPFLFLLVVDVLGMILSDYEYMVLDYINLFLNGGPGPGAYYYVILIQMIFVFPIIYFLVKKYNSKGLLACFLLNFLFELCKNAYAISGGTYRLLIFRYIFLLGFGCWLSNNKNGFSLMQKIVGVGLFIIGALFIVLTAYLNYKPIIFNEWTGTSLISSMFICPIVACLLRLNIKFLPISFLGKCSYHIFIVQIGIYYFVSESIYKYFLEPYIQILMCLILCLVTGVIFYLIESRISKKIFNQK